MPENAKIMTLHDHDTGKPIAPRTTIKALSGEGKKWNYVGFTDDNVLGLIEGSYPCNENLLINGYFVGGGSQKGGAHFPINQRGETTYVGGGAAKYTIDMWQYSASDPNAKMIIEDDGIVFDNREALSDGTWCIQYPSKDIPAGNLTCTILVEECSGPTGIYGGNGKDAYGNDNYYMGIEAPGLKSSTVYSNGLAAEDRGAYLINIVTTPGAYIKIKAVKIELGTQQTLAHQENGVWVLNEIPNYQQELAKCQRYQLIATTCMTAPYYHTRSNIVAAFLPTPVTLRIKPSLIGAPTIYTISSNTLVKNASIAVNALNNNGISFNITGATEPCYIFFGTGKGLDANL